jgi:hypothetical protein
MKSNSISFFTLDENADGKKIIKGNSGIENDRSYKDVKRDNEWMQEYYIIYKSHILDDLNDEDSVVENELTI